MPRYHEVAADLHRRIETGEFPPGTTIPHLREIMTEYSVSRPTATAAVRLIQEQGLVEAIRRRGTVVRERPAGRLVIRARRVERDADGYYFGPDSQHWTAPGGHQVDQQPIPAEIGKLLDVEPGTPTWVRATLSSDPERPAHRQLAASWLSPRLIAELPAVTAPSGEHPDLYDLIEGHYESPLSWTEEVSARTATHQEVQELGLPPGVPVLRILRAGSLGTGKSEWTCEVTDTRMSAELFGVQYPVKRAPSARWT